MKTNKTITALFYSDCSVFNYLNKSESALKQDLLIELSTSPNLSYILNLMTPENYPGICGICGDHALETLTVEHHSLPAPIILAPGKLHNHTSLSQCIGLLKQLKGSLTSITLLIHIDEVSQYRTSLPHIDSFQIAWDLNTPLSPSAQQAIALLKEDELLSESSWEGIIFYHQENTHDSSKALEPLLKDSEAGSIVSL